LYEALKFNQRIWSIFQGGPLNEDNPLPKKLRLDVLRLSGFVDRQILETLASPAEKNLKLLSTSTTISLQGSGVHRNEAPSFEIVLSMTLSRN